MRMLFAPIVLASPLLVAQQPEREPGAFYWSDFDGDGLVDAYVVLEGGGAKLLANRGDGGFRDVTEASGLGAIAGVDQAAWADFDGDHRLDLFLASWRGTSRLLVQRVPGAFAEVGDDAGLWGDSAPLDARALDFDADGRADLQLVTAAGDVLLHNLGGGAFERVELGFPTARPAASGLDLDVERARLGLPPLGPRGAAELVHAPGVTAGPAATPAAGSAEAAAAATQCLPTIEDLAAPGTCLAASSVPTFGALYPLGNELFIEAGSGFVGVGTTAPQFPLDVAGDVRASGQVRIDATAAPLVVGSTVKVQNLNADLLDGLEASVFPKLPITDVEVGVGAAIAGTKITPDFGAQPIRTTGELMADGGVSTVGHVRAGFGLEDVPSVRFASNESAGLSSPSFEQLNLISGGATRVRLRQDGRIAIGGDSADTTVQIACPGDPAFGTTLFAANAGSAAAAIEAEASGSSASAVRGTHSGFDLGYGVLGVAQGLFSRGVQGRNLFGGPGVYGEASGTSARGVVGDATGSSSIGVLGQGLTGVQGESESAGSRAVLGIGFAPAGGSFTDGVVGIAHASSGYGVWGQSAGGNNTAVHGLGNITATGTKSFLQPHPTEPDKVVRFVCLEGDEAGTYFRGSAKLVGGECVIDVPEAFRMTSVPHDLTVQVTPRGPAMVWVESIDLSRVVVRGSPDVAFDYFVNGLRLGYADVDVVVESRAYRPTVRGVPFGEQLPEEIRAILIANGTLNADLTPNEATAAQLGWELAEPER